MSIEGEIRVALRWNGSEVVAADVRSTRPFAAPRVLAGRRVDEACALVPLFFSVCGRSQAIAAAAACEAALGIAPPPGVAAARALIVAGEAMQEYLFRMLIGWPESRGEPAAAPLVGEVRRRIAAALAPVAAVARPAAEAPAAGLVTQAGESLRDATAEATGAVLGTGAAEWLDVAERGELDAWAARGDTAAARLAADLLEADPGFGATDVALLPAGATAGLAEGLAEALAGDPTFECAPTWLGGPAETGALARTAGSPGVSAFVARFGRSVLARVVARVAELARLASGTFNAPVGQLALGRGGGIAWVETARGLLIHRAQVKDNRVDAYRIVAPTEWNFHPRGALPRGLAGVRFAGRDAAARGARMLVDSLDPCVAARIEVLHA
ncbi:MAG: nickel-dependent hydrogenase large subunit [Burkholderiales bacterium]|nr:nickel-dependent hydrogenase large subunit [Burkholderiales bacterium]